MSTSRLVQAEAAIDRSDIVAFVEPLIAARTRGLGRPREIPVRTLFVALVMQGLGGRFHLSRVVEYLNDLPETTRRRLGLEREGDITRRQVENLYGLICEVLEGNKNSATRWVCLTKPVRNWSVPQCTRTLFRRGPSRSTAPASTAGERVGVRGRSHV